MENLEKRQNLVRKYLLGNVGEEAEMRRIEEKIMLDDEFAEQIEIAEDELIEEYLDEMLDGAERERFVQFFLGAPENRKKLRFIRNLRAFAVSHAAPIVEEFSEEKKRLFEWRKLFAAPAFRLTAIALLLFGIGFGIWRAAFYQTEVERGLAQLQIAYGGERSIESRIAGFDYAPLNNTRGARGADDADSKLARQRAEGFLLHAVAEDGDAAAFLALGKFYLVEKRFGDADEQFKRAASLAPNDAHIHSDWGALLLEMGKKAAAENAGAQSLEFFDRSLAQIEKAVALAPQLPEPRFNRALCLQAMGTFAAAQKAWREYLEIDANSAWAGEARRNLQILESKKPVDQSAAEIERDFLEAFRRQDEERAWHLLSGNRELIQGKYLPQRLAVSYLRVGGDEEKKDLLAALEYAGALEKKRARDSFAGEIARFYAALPENKVESLKQAHVSVEKGFQLGRGENYGAALKEFKTARELFRQAGDVRELELSDYSIAYYTLNNNDINESLEMFQSIADSCAADNYKWLEQSARHWVAGSNAALGKYTEAKRNYQKSLAIAKEIEDYYAVQRNLNGLATVSSAIGQPRTALNYAQQTIVGNGAANAGARQKWRNYYTTLKVLIAAKLYHAAKAFGTEAVSLAEANKNSVFATLSYVGAGSAFSQSGNFSEAREWLNAGYRQTETMADESARKKITAFSLLRLAYLERELGNYDASLEFYERAIADYEKLELPFYLYEAHKGRLLTNLALKNDAEVERQIPSALSLIERYRENILEEQERSSFFDTEQSIYDTAAAFEFGRGRIERAYEYAENSNSRALFDRLQKSAPVSGSRQNSEESPENKKPFSLAEIREQMPENTQILQYTVLENRVLIWLVSKKQFVAVPAEISADNLRGKIESYLKLLQRKDEAAQTEARQAARELYDLLIEPVGNHLDPAQDVCLIPNKILFYLPFATLVAPDERYFLTRFELLYAPSANVFLSCTKNALEKSVNHRETVLSVGNPAFDRAEFAELSDLPAAETEAREAAAFYSDSRILLGDKATKTAFRGALKTAEIVHFAGHYTVVPNAPLASNLLLAKNDGKPEESILTNAELVGETLPRARLIVLSACQTGAESYQDGEGLVGLSRTFLAAGAPLVVASFWKVDSDATAELMKRFHFHRRREKISTVAALRRAQIEMLDAPAGRFRAPYFWAAFAAFGGHAPF